MKIKLTKTGEADIDDKDSTFCGQHCTYLANYDEQDAIWCCSWFDNAELEWDEEKDALKRCAECIKGNLRCVL